MGIGGLVVMLPALYFRVKNHTEATDEIIVRKAGTTGDDV
jgi:hypothetical protein